MHPALQADPQSEAMSTERFKNQPTVALETSRAFVIRYFLNTNTTSVGNIILTWFRHHRKPEKGA